MRAILQTSKMNNCQHYSALGGKIIYDIPMQCAFPPPLSTPLGWSLGTLVTTLLNTAQRGNNDRCAKTNRETRASTPSHDPSGLSSFPCVSSEPSST